MNSPFALLAPRTLRLLLPPAALTCALAIACSSDPPPGDNGGTGANGGTAPTGGTGGTTGGTAGSSLGGTGGTAGTPPTTGGTGGAAGSGGSLGGAAGTPTGGASGAPVGGSSGTSGAGGSAGETVGGAGGVSGSAGVAGAAGGAAGDTAGTAGSGTAGTGGAAPAGFFMEDFESGTTGMGPAGWDTFIAYNKNGANPSGDTLALVDGTRFHGGSKALHVHAGSSPAMITRPLPNGTNKLYVRAWVYMTRQLGNIPADQNPNHETLIGLRAMTNSASDEVRFGEIKGVIGTSYPKTADNISPTQASWNSGPSVPANTWACYEVAFLGETEPHTLHAWVDGTLVHEITSIGTDQWQNSPMPANWLDGEFTELILGWHSFSNATVDLWMDDIVLSTSPIGCG